MKGVLGRVNARGIAQETSLVQRVLEHQHRQHGGVRTRFLEQLGRLTRRVFGAL
ncbi:MAG: hypothetical protein ABIK89_15350 [Planctomycetota bacterium]